MWNSIKMSLPHRLLPLLFLPSMLCTEPSYSSDLWISFSQKPTSSTFNPNSTEEDELSASIQSPSLGPSPQVTMEKNEDRSVPENYLYTSDSSLLSSFNCHQPFQLPSQRGVVPPDLQSLLGQASLSLTNTINFLNLIFQASELRETSIREDIEWYHALVRSMLVGESSGLVRSALLTFAADPTASQPQLVLRCSRGLSSNIYLQDLTLAWKTHQLSLNMTDQSWVTLQKSSNLPPGLSKQVLINDLRTLDTPKWAYADTYVSNSSGLWWGDAPFLECEDGHYLPGWLLKLSMPLYGLKPDLSPEFRGVIQVDVNIQGFNVNQCATGDFWFADTHQCNRTSMECEPIPGQGFRLGQYYCRCKEGYYSLPADLKDLNAGANSTRVPVCLPCWPGCKRCQDGSPCWVEEDWVLRAALLAIQGFFMALVLFNMLKSYQCRRYRRIRASGLLLLEIILFGSLLLYFPVFILYFKPSTFRCILLRWVRFLGFAIVYGTVMLKMYRVLNVFLSCTAQRVPYMTNASVLRKLGVMVLIVNWFLCSWTAGALQNQGRNVPLLITLTTSDGLSFTVCDLDRWDYMMSLAELLFLCWGSLLSSAVKTVPSAFHEPRYMGIAIHNELFFSTIFHLLRFIRPFLHPDRMITLFFIHTHVTITVTLGLLFIPKFLHMSRPAKEEIASEMYEDEVDLHRSCIHLNSSFTSACWNDHSLDPDDIRDELKKLYARLEIHKTKKMANSNPHLQKKRSSRLLLGRSIIKRIAEFPESMSRQCSRKDKDASGSRGKRKCSGCYIAKTPSQKIQKSYSVCEYVQERDTTLMNSSVVKHNEKRPSKAESIDTAPVISKSASAHNLAVDTNLLQPVALRVQKSFSFTESHRDQYPPSSKSTGNTYLALKVSPEDKSLQVQDNVKKKATNTDVCILSIKNEDSAGTNMSNQKQVDNSVSQKGPQTRKLTSSPSLLYVCPWEFAIPMHTPSSPEAEGDHGMDSERPKPLISSSAPGSPYGFARSTDRHVFSFRSATQTLLLARGLVAGKEGGKQSSKTELRKEEGSTNQTKMKLALCSTLSSGRKTPQTRRAMTCVDSKPCLMKQAAIRMSSNDSSERSSISSSPPHICLWKSEDIGIKNENPYGGMIHKSGNQRLFPVSSSEINKSILHKMRSLTVPNAEVCPWDVPLIQQSNIADICPWEVNEPEQLQSKSLNDVSFFESDSEQVQMTTEQKAQIDVCSLGVPDKTSSTSEKCKKGPDQDYGCTESGWCPCSVPSFSTSQVNTDPPKSTSDTSIPTERVIYVNAQAEDSDINRKALVKQETLQNDFCPWETSKAEAHQKRICVDVCPWERGHTSGEGSETGKITEPKTSTRSLCSTKQLPSSTEICPWDFAKSPQSDTRAPQRQESDHATVCSWESLNACLEEKPKKTVKKNTVTQNSLTHFTSTEDVCPWDFLESSPTMAVNYPLESEEAFTKSETVTEGWLSTTKEEDLCPLQAIEFKSSDKKSMAITSDGNICPRQAEQTPELTEIQDIIREDICQWEPECSDKSEESVHIDVCPWETNSERPTNSEDSTSKMKVHLISPTAQEVRANRPLARCDALCPWEIKGESQTSTIEHDNNSDVFTWEEPIPEEEEADAEAAAEAFVFPPDL